MSDVLTSSFSQFALFKHFIEAFYDSSAWFKFEVVDGGQCIWSSPDMMITPKVAKIRLVGRENCRCFQKVSLWERVRRAWWATTTLPTLLNRVRFPAAADNHASSSTNGSWGTQGSSCISTISVMATLLNTADITMVMANRMAMCVMLVKGERVSPALCQR